MIYQNRKEAGELLAEKLKSLHLPNDTIVLALPRGGVPVAYRVAQLNHWLLDVCLVRKIGSPLNPEYAIGAMAKPDVVLWNEFELKNLDIQENQKKQMIRLEGKELDRREFEYRGDKPYPQLKNKTVVIVDDGIATGYTIKAAIYAVKSQQPTKIIVAVPVASPESIRELENMSVKVICPLIPYALSAVGAWYEDFSQTTDQEVKYLLAKK